MKNCFICKKELIEWRDFICEDCDEKFEISEKLEKGIEVVTICPNCGVGEMTLDRFKEKYSRYAEYSEEGLGIVIIYSNKCPECCRIEFEAFSVSIVRVKGEI